MTETASAPPQAAFPSVFCLFFHPLQHIVNLPELFPNCHPIFCSYPLPKAACHYDHLNRIGRLLTYLKKVLRFWEESEAGS